MKKVVVSGMIGNGLEWYDYALYGQMAVVLSVLFFPAGDKAAALLATFGIFAVGFIVRPLGAILFGYIGDKYGRKKSLVIAILMMAIPTGCIGLLPTYESIGILAPILLTVIRVLQGLSLGGEFSGSIIYIVEHAPPHRKGIAGSASLASLIIGFLMGSLVSLFFVTALSEEDFMSWGWRVPFLFGVVIGLVGLYIRTHCDESPAYKEAKAQGVISKQPLKDVFSQHKKPMLQGFLAYLTVTVPFYLLSVYMISYMQTELQMSKADALLVNALAMATQLITILVAAQLSDIYGRKKIMLTAAILMLVCMLPIFLMMETKGFYEVLGAQVLLSLILGFYLGPVAAFLVELFPTSIRYTGMSLSYNFSAAFFGGTVPIVCTWLVTNLESHLWIAVYVMVCNLLSIGALLSYKEKAHA